MNPFIPPFEADLRRRDSYPTLISENNPSPEILRWSRAVQLDVSIY